MDSMIRVRREIVRIYAECRNGRMPWEVGTRAAYMLTCVGRMIEGSELETRLAALEAQAPSDSDEIERKDWR